MTREEVIQRMKTERQSVTEKGVIWKLDQSRDTTTRLFGIHVELTRELIAGKLVPPASCELHWSDDPSKTHTEQWQIEFLTFDLPVADHLIEVTDDLADNGRFDSPNYRVTRTLRYRNSGPGVTSANRNKLYQVFYPDGQREEYTYEKVPGGGMLTSIISGFDGQLRKVETTTDRNGKEIHRMAYIQKGVDAKKRPMFIPEPTDLAPGQEMPNADKL